MRQHAQSHASPSSVRGTNGGSAAITVAGTTVLADCAGAIYWPEEGLLAVADLHLEKGSGLAARGALLPPYDTAATLARLSELVARYAPRTIVAMGDSFHDGHGPARIAEADRAVLKALQRGREWIWIAGNHDPHPAKGIEGVFTRELALGSLRFRHEPAQVATSGEIAGHLHPIARIRHRGYTISRRCFATNGSRLVMPAFGAYAGGLNIRERACVEVFGSLAFTAHLMGERRLYPFAATRCLEG